VLYFVNGVQGGKIEDIDTHECIYWINILSDLYYDGGAIGV
jgi:hypothetical protein